MIMLIMGRTLPVIPKNLNFSYFSSNQPPRGGKRVTWNFNRNANRNSEPEPDQQGDGALFNFIRQYRDAQGRPICWRCGSPDHDRVNCPQRKRLLERAKELARSQTGMTPQEN